FDEIRPYLSLGLTRLPISRSISSRDIGAFWSSYHEIKGLQPDVLHGHGAKGGAIARLIGSAPLIITYRVARLYSPHGGTLHYKRRSATGLAILTAEQVLERLGDALVFVCDYEREAYAARVGRPRV